MPNLDPEQRRILRQIKREGRHVKDRRKRRVYERAAVETGLVESSLRNLPGGDADSQGWRQERASLYRDPRNVPASVRRFRQEFEQHYDPGERSYEVAAQVQRPAAQYRGRYHDRAREAAAILRQLGGDDGDEPAATGTRTKTTPGVDRSQERTALKAGYLLNRHDPDALLNLKRGLDEAQDVPERTERVRVRAKRRKGSASRTGDSTTNIVELGKLAQSMGLRVGEHPEFGGVGGGHVAGSYHGKGAAIDVSGDPAKMAKFARRVSRRYGKDLEELIWRGAHSRTIKHGKRVPKNFYSKHQDHVHVADVDD